MKILEHYSIISLISRPHFCIIYFVFLFYDNSLDDLLKCTAIHLGWMKLICSIHIIIN